MVLEHDFGKWCQLGVDRPTRLPGLPGYEWLDACPMTLVIRSEEHAGSRPMLEVPLTMDVLEEVLAIANDGCQPLRTGRPPSAALSRARDQLRTKLAAGTLLMRPPNQDVSYVFSVEEGLINVREGQRT